MLNLLAIDDDVIDMMTLKRCLNKAGIAHTLETAPNGEDALRLLRARSRSSSSRLVVLCDLNMPRMNGFQFMRELRADPMLASTVVIIVTTSSYARDREEAFSLKCAGYFVKPLDVDPFTKLLQSIDRYWTAAQFPT